MVQQHPEFPWKPAATWNNKVGQYKTSVANKNLNAIKVISIPMASNNLTSLESTISFPKKIK